jgi:acyl-[acyl-carrier-protein]-phospholipid O-acyltransferase/long-chain-fatty-acid--[acyl-carrier-protein] ligase
MGVSKEERSLAEVFVRAARKNWARRCISDSMGKSYSYGQVLTTTVSLAEQLDKITKGQDRVGILLPPSTGAALVNFAAALLGRVTVNLNYSVTNTLVESAVEQSGIETIISSKSFISKMKKLKDLPRVVFLEEITEGIGWKAKVRAYLKARLLPVESLVRARRGKADSPATIIFSSGSSGRPKGVMLSHRNIISNIESLVSIFDLRPADNLCGVLPFFHSFGYTCSLWLPVFAGVSASYAANPLDASTVGRVAGQNRSTILFAAPSFLPNYIRRVEPADFSGLRAVVVGAEKMKKRIADAFEERFGVRPLEGYGATELSPVVSLNIPDELSRNPELSGHKEGSVGKLIPGIEIRIVDPQDGRELPFGQEGLLEVKGPNVMCGYLNDEQQTREVIKDGWYNTQDMASIDGEGFLTITGRQSRFSKIAGEMVPHSCIEHIFHNALDTDEQLVAVTSVPDDRKGEELVVLYLEQAGEAEELYNIICQSDLPNLWKPRRENYIKIESMPALGSGKLDVAQLRKIAEQAKRLAT